MKIGILTFHQAINFGAVLQAYALQETLKSLGHDATVIDYTPTWDNSVHGGVLFELKQRIKKVLFTPVHAKRSKIFKAFCDQHLKLDGLNLNDATNDYDAFILGSDQIWNPVITANGFDHVYFGDFVSVKGIKKISYAGSIGSTNNVSDTQKKEFIDLLNSLDGVSIREKELQDYLTENSVKSHIVLDPVLLSGKECFEHLVHEVKEKEPYLLVFQINRDQSVLDYAKRVANELNLKLVEIVPMVATKDVSFRNQTMSPSDFLSYIHHASYIVTGSFHATAFSILFHKKLSVLENAKASSRMKSLLESVGLIDRLTNDYNAPINKNALLSEIDYNAVENKLADLRCESINYLKSNLANE